MHSFVLDYAAYGLLAYRMATGLEVHQFVAVIGNDVQRYSQIIFVSPSLLEGASIDGERFAKLMRDRVLSDFDCSVEYTRPKGTSYNLLESFKVVYADHREVYANTLRLNIERLLESFNVMVPS